MFTSRLTSGRLLEVVHQADKPSLNIVVVPELGTTLRSDRLPSSWRWLRDLIPSAAPDAQVIAFDMSLSSEKIPIWQRLMQSSADLVSSLIGNSDKLLLAESPLLFICHGYGGVVVKRAFNNWHEGYYDPNLRRLINVQNGIVFLGTPHATYTGRSDWLRLNLLLRSSVKLQPFVLAQAETEAATIANISLKFEDLGLKIPVISVYELKKTKISDGLLSSRKELLVDCGLAETGLKGEKLFPADADHPSVCRLESRSQAFEEFRGLIKTALAQRDIIRRDFDTSGQVSNTTEPEAILASTISESDDEDSSARRLSELSIAQATKGSMETAQASLEVIASVSENPRAKEKPMFPCHLLDPHSPNADFVGHDDLFEILDQVCLPDRQVDTSKPGLNSCVISGLGGVGKTQLIVEYTFRRRTNFEAIFWVNASELNKLAERFHQIAVALNLVDKNDTGDRVVTRNLVIEYLSQTGSATSSVIEEDDPAKATELKWLLIFDNADDPGLIHDYWPINGRGSIIVTSRDPVTGSYLDARKSVVLEGLAEADAAILLQRLTGQGSRDEVDPCALAIAKRFRGLPLAINLVAAVIRRRDLILQEFDSIYKDTSISDLYQSPLTKQNDTYGHDLSTVWALKGLGPGARNLLDLLAILDPDELAESIFTRAISHVKHEVFFASQAAYVNARTDLIKSSLLKRNRDLGQISLHRLVQDAAKLCFTPQRLKDVFELATTILAWTWPYPEDRYNHNPELFADFEKILPHITSLQVVFQSYSDIEIGMDLVTRLSELLQQGGWYLQERGNFDEALSMFETALKICERHQEDMAELYADVLFCVASTLAEQNEKDRALHFATRHFDQRLKHEKKRPKLSLYGALAYSELGLSQILNGRYEEAAVNCAFSRRIAFEDQEFLDGTYWPYFGTIHLAFALSALGKQQQALLILSETVEWGKKHYGPEPNSFKLVNSYHDRRRFTQGLQASLCALRTWQRQVEARILRGEFRSSSRSTPNFYVNNG